jgi:hypothetical protein
MGPLPLKKKLQSVENQRLNAIEEDKTSEDFFLPCQKPAKDNEKNNCQMTSEMSQPGEHGIKDL